MDKVKQGAMKASEMLSSSTEAAPSSSLLKDVHARIFENVLREPGQFRDNLEAVQENNGNSLCPKAEIEKQLVQNARKHFDLLRVAEQERKEHLALKDGEAAKKIADYHSEFMRTKPFKDIEGSNFINKTVGLTVMKSQIGHCVPDWKYQNAKSVEAAAYQQALRWSHHSPDHQGKLQLVVKDLAGQPDNVHYLKDHEKKNEMGHYH